jgi:hypothetical protein
MAAGLLVLFEVSGLVATDCDVRVSRLGEEPAAVGAGGGALGALSFTLAQR